MAEKTGVQVTDIEKFCIWGNHSSTQFPDITYTTIKGKSARTLINDDKWVVEKFIPDVQQRGAAIIAARGASSAASAANAAIDHVRDWVHGTGGKWTSMAVPSNGEYGSTKGIWYSYPVVCKGGKYEIVPSLPIDNSQKERLQKTDAELVEEKKGVAALLD